ncbi:MAG TPA: sensor histidine kinase, partial [Kribbella sp.]|uniref:sensor histidine kinase n=1 Tax=Kribbella sp. TaxID=1871183 RepID=UPI002D7982CF
VALASLGGLLLLVTGWSAYSALNDLPVPGLPNTVVRIGDRSGPSIGDDVTTIERGAASNAWNTASVAGLALVAAWAIGSSVYNRRALLGQLHARALDLERERDHRATLAVAAERGRISRELHDVVAHGLSMIVIQAQGGAAALDDRPTDTRTALEAIVKTGRDSLADMRRAVGALGEVDDSWQPQPGLAHLPALLSQVRQTGTPVRLQVEGTVAELPSAVDLSAYRLIQEALTNTMKHAGTGATAEVSVCFRPAELSLEVRDDGRAAPGDDSLGPDSLTGDDGLTDAGGNGLRGMRERVKLLGGRLEAGPAPEGGFVVRATLPIERRHA